MLLSSLTCQGNNDGLIEVFIEQILPNGLRGFAAIHEGHIIVHQD
jgi:hypothetical protein